MRILTVHNAYQQPGGEDQVFAAEARLLRESGHDVATFCMHNDQVRDVNPLKLAVNTFWSRSAYQSIRNFALRHGAEVVHFHNTFPLISPSGYAAAREAGAAVVQTLHNFRLLCISPYLFRKGKVCEDCLGRTLAWPGVLRGCYSQGYSAGAVAATAMAAHRVLGTWQDAVDLFIAPSEFARQKFLAARLPMGQVVVKPNFVYPDPGAGDHGGEYAVFVGRLSPEKGIGVLLDAWSRLADRIPLKIIGDGPLAERVRQAQERDSAIQWLGQRPASEVADIIGRARVLVAPSVCYETFGRVVAEAFAKGTPVIASRLGALEEIVDHGRTGLLFRAGDAEDLRAQVLDLLADPQRYLRMSSAARAEFLAKYTGSVNSSQLESIYRQASTIAQQRRQTADEFALAEVSP